MVQVLHLPLLNDIVDSAGNFSSLLNSRVARDVSCALDGFSGIFRTLLDIVFVVFDEFSSLLCAIVGCFGSTLDLLAGSLESFLNSLLRDKMRELGIVASPSVLSESEVAVVSGIVKGVSNQTIVVVEVVILSVGVEVLGLVIIHGSMERHLVGEDGSLREGSDGVLVKLRSVSVHGSLNKLIITLICVSV